MARLQCVTTLLRSIHCGARKLHSFLDATQKSHLVFFSFIPCACKKLSFFSMQKAKKLPHVAFETPLLNVKKFTLGSILSFNNPENADNFFCEKYEVKNHQIITYYNLNNFTPHMKIA
jgi:hypothetical protein